MTPPELHALLNGIAAQVRAACEPLKAIGTVRPTVSVMNVSLETVGAAAAIGRHRVTRHDGTPKGCVYDVINVRVEDGCAIDLYGVHRAPANDAERRVAETGEGIEVAHG